MRSILKMTMAISSMLVATCGSGFSQPRPVKIKKGVVTDYYTNGKVKTIIEYIPKDSLNQMLEKVRYADSLIKYAYDTVGNATVNNGNGHYIKYGLDNNTIIEEGDVQSGVKANKWIGIDPALKLSYIEYYSSGKLKMGTATDANNNSYSYTSKIKQPEFASKDAKNALGEFIGNALRYPASALQSGTQGKVVASVFIAEDGKPRNLKILRSAGYDLDQEAMRVLTMMPDWTPGELYGKKTGMYTTIPVSFTLR